MRETILQGLDDGLQYNFGGDVGIICAVRRIATHFSDYLACDCTLSGKELIEFIKQYATDHIDIINDIDENNRYKLTAYDW